MKTAIAIAIAVMSFAGAAHATTGTGGCYDVRFISMPEPPGSPAADPFSGNFGGTAGS